MGYFLTTIPVSLVRTCLIHCEDQSFCIPIGRWNMAGNYSSHKAMCNRTRRQSGVNTARNSAFRAFRIHHNEVSSFWENCFDLTTWQWNSFIFWSIRQIMEHVNILDPGYKTNVEMSEFSIEQKFCIFLCSSLCSILKFISRALC